MHIEVTNIISARTAEGRVEVAINGKPLMQISTEEARKFAIDLLEVASGAEAEACLVKFLREDVKLTLDQVVEVLQAFRKQKGVV